MVSILTVILILTRYGLALLKRLILAEVARQLKSDKYSDVKHTNKLSDSNEVLIIYNNITAHLIMEEPITTIKIISKEYTKTQRMMFDNLWNQSNE